MKKIRNVGMACYILDIKLYAWLFTDLLFNDIISICKARTYFGDQYKEAIILTMAHNI